MKFLENSGLTGLLQLSLIQLAIPSTKNVVTKQSNNNAEDTFNALALHKEQVTYITCCL